MLSYWERKYFTSYDTIIVGSGLAGLFTALFLKRKYPEERIVILSKGIISQAASTKNAGFACMGSITELEDDLRTSSIDEVVSLFEKRYHGLQLMRKELGDENIGYEESGSYELLEGDDLNLASKVYAWNQRLYNVAKREAFSMADIANFSFKGFGAVIKNELEGGIDTGKTYYFLKKKVQQSGVELLSNTEVQDVDTKNNYVYLNEGIRLMAKRIILCTNAFTADLIPEIPIQPARAQVLITTPVPNLSFKGIYHFDRGYYYFREVDGRVLFGGGRQLDLEGETTSSMGPNKKILEDLEKKLRENILVDTNYKIDYSWSGIMGKARTKGPIIKEVSQGVFVLAGFGGMGVALGAGMAMQLVEKL